MLRVQKINTTIKVNEEHKMKLNKVKLNKILNNTINRYWIDNLFLYKILVIDSGRNKGF